MIQKSNKSRLKVLAAFCAPMLVALVSTPVFAKDCQTGILPQTWCEDGGLMVMIKDIIWILSVLVWILGSIFIGISGFIWMTATDDPGKVATAKKRILEIVIGMLAFLLLDVIAQYLGIAK